MAERLRTRVAGIRLRHAGHTITFTISLGVAVLRGTDAAIEQIIARADATLFCAKGGGRNRLLLDAAVNRPIRHRMDRRPPR